MASPPDRLPNLDLLRLAAASMVVLFHFGYRGPATAGWTPAAYPEIAWLAQEAWAGVSLFFLISGFVIAWSADRRAAWDFAVARAARLYPAFIVCMSITALGLAVLAPPGVAELQMSPARWAANVPLFSKAFGQPFVDGAYWSIVVEVVFYAWVAALMALGLFQRRQLAILAAWLAVSLLNELVLRQQGLQYLLATRHAGYFALGILSYRCFASGRPPDRRELALGAAALALCLIDDRAYVGWMQGATGYAAPWSLAFAAVKLALMMTALNVAVRAPAALPAGLCLALGGLTYPLYLVHQNLGYTLLHRLDPFAGRWGALALAVVAVFAAAWAVNRTAEPHGRRLILEASAKLRLALDGRRLLGAR